MNRGKFCFFITFISSWYHLEVVLAELRIFVKLKNKKSVVSLATEPLWLAGCWERDHQKRKFPSTDRNQWVKEYRVCAGNVVSKTD